MSGSTDLTDVNEDTCEMMKLHMKVNKILKMMKIKKVIL